MAKRTDKKDGVNLPDPDDPLLYPDLSQRQLTQVQAAGTCCSFARGETLFEHGEKNAPVFVLKSGSVDLFDRKAGVGKGGDPDGHKGEQGHFLTIDKPTFLGDISMFTGEPTLAACVAAGPVEAVRIDRPALRELVAQYSDIGDLMLTAFMARRAWLRENSVGQMQLIGSRDSRDTFRLRDFLTRNGMPFEWSDPAEDADTAALLEQLDIPRDATPVLIAGSTVCRKPSVEKVAKELQLTPDLGDEPYDVVVVGAGPAGLAAAVYGASEGLRTLALDADSPGGQAGTSSKIENYLGFATGISGGELARQAVIQARKFDATLSNPTRVGKLDCDGQYKYVGLVDGRTVRARALIIATGAEYRRLEGEGFERFEGSGVYYAAGHPEAVQCRDEQVIIVGGGNSAGQAAIFMSQHARRVYLVIRGDDLGKSMSQYLTARIDRAENIEVLKHSQVTALQGEEHPHVATLSTSDGERQIEASAVFVMIGALPRTEWLAEGDCVGLCPKGFVATGAYAREHDRFADHWSLDREPHFLETTRAGIFAVGDVRSGSVKRVASAVGEGSMAIQYVHEVLAA